VPLIVWQMAVRIRRLISRQRSKPIRHWLAAIFFPVLISLLAATVLAALIALTALAVGVAGGIARLWRALAIVFSNGNAIRSRFPACHPGIWA